MARIFKPILGMVVASILALMASGCVQGGTVTNPLSAEPPADPSSVEKKSVRFEVVGDYDSIFVDISGEENHGTVNMVDTSFVRNGTYWLFCTDTLDTIHWDDGWSILAGGVRCWKGQYEYAKSFRLQTVDTLISTDSMYCQNCDRIF